MSSTSQRADLVSRRGALIAELFLQDLEPAFVARSTLDVGYDFLVGLRNHDGGINNAAVVVKATEHPVGNRLPFPRELFDQLAYSNIPVLLLVANAKENRLYYGWIKPDLVKNRDNIRSVSVPLTEIHEETTKLIREQLMR